MKKMQWPGTAARCVPACTPARMMTWMLTWMLVLVALFGTVGSARAADPSQGPGGPILVLTSGNANYGKYYAEILRNEGLNAFTVADIATLSASQLAAYDLVILARAPLAAAQASTLTAWVNGGGNLIAMAPDASLNALLGLNPTGSTLANAYLLVDTATTAGNGIVGQTMQFHGSANLYTLGTASRIATLYSTATASTANPAVTLNNVGSGKAHTPPWSWPLTVSCGTT